MQRPPEAAATRACLQAFPAADRDGPRVGSRALLLVLHRARLVGPLRAALQRVVRLLAVRRLVPMVRRERERPWVAAVQLVPVQVPEPQRAEAQQTVPSVEASHHARPEPLAERSVLALPMVRPEQPKALRSVVEVVLCELQAEPLLEAEVVPQQAAVAAQLSGPQPEAVAVQPLAQQAAAEAERPSVLLQAAEVVEAQP